MRRRSDAAAILCGILTFVCVGLTSSCGSGDSANQAVQTKAMEQHLQEVKQNYGKQTADMYRAKAAQKQVAKKR
jgi:hypothetical protein